jgi:hypothetical protein
VIFEDSSMPNSADFYCEQNSVGKHSDYKADVAVTSIFKSTIPKLVRQLPTRCIGTVERSGHTMAISSNNPEPHLYSKLISMYIIEANRNFQDNGL